MNVKLLTGAASATLVCGGLVAAGQAEGPDGGNIITMTVDDAGQLDPGNDVRSAGVRVGSIQSIELVRGKAQVTLKVADGILPIHTDATATVGPVNLLGESMISLDRGSASAPFSKDNVIATENATTAVTLADVINTFHEPTAANLAAVVTTLGEGFNGNGSEVAAALKLAVPAMQDTERLGNILSEQNAILADLIATADPVAASVAGPRGERIDLLLQSTRDILAALSNQQTAFDQTLRQLPSTLRAAEQTLDELRGAARNGAPVLHSLRPLTRDLNDVVDELNDFSESADPALASLKPVLERADALLLEAAPVVAALRPRGDDLAVAAASLEPVSRELLDLHLQDVMDFVRKWSLSTNGRDGLSHYFRGVVYVTPTTLKEIAQSIIPAGVNLPGATAAPLGSSRNGKQESSPQLPAGPQLPEVPLPDLNQIVPPNLLKGVLGGQPPAASKRSSTDPSSALGLSSKQEQGLVGQLLGGPR